MALDWSKNISFSGLRKRAPKVKSSYPSKTYINLVVSSKKKLDLRSTAPKAVLIALLVLVVCKFGIFDFYDRMNQKQAELTKQEQVLDNLRLQLSDYAAVKAEYDTYETTKLVADDLTVSALDALDLVDRYVANAAHIDSLDLQGNTVSLNLSDITLNGVGKLVSKLYEQPIVANVSVSTATTGKESETSAATATMVITLQVAA